MIRDLTMPKNKRMGLVQVYTGNGKGKTTAAFGLALRGAGCGLKVCIHQFMKGGKSGEFTAARKIAGITINRSGQCKLIKGKPLPEDKRMAKSCLVKARNDIYSKKYDIVILDEINIAMRLGLVEEEDIMEIIDNRPAGIELVLTGRYCPASILKKADLITEMNETRHPYRDGITARMGIEY